MSSYRNISKKIFSRTLNKYALSIYTPTHARSYRLSDDDYYNVVRDEGRFAFIRNVSSTYHRPTILDMGCGTGRYFHCCNNAQRVVAFDLSRAMLLEAKNPVASVSTSVTLLNSSIDEIEFKPLSFDVVYCLGVLGGSLPLEKSILIKVAQWLKPGGFFCFDVIQRFLVPDRGTWRSCLAEKMRPYLIRPAKAYVDAKLLGFTIDKSDLHALVSQHFKQVEIEEIGGRGREDLLCRARI